MMGSSEVRNSVMIVGMLLMLKMLSVMVSIVSDGIVLLMLKICMKCLVWCWNCGWFSSMLVGMFMVMVSVIE